VIPPPGPEFPRDELGAHVSTAGGVEKAPARALEVGAVNLQLFTKQPNRWQERSLAPGTGERFQGELREAGIQVAGAHDSYLINLSSPDPGLWDRSLASFAAELARCEALGLDFVVTHPGNATDGDHASGIARNAEGVARALESVPGGVKVLLEITAGTGTSVGSTLEALGAIIQGVPAELRGRVGVCFDTCHAWSAGYDLAGDYHGVWSAFQEVLGLERLHLFHLNDSKHPFNSRKDRHEMIGEGSLGEAPFRALMTDPRFAGIPKLLETPKGDDGVTNDRVNLARLRSYRAAGVG